MGFVVELFVSWCDFLQQDQPYHLPSVIFLVSLNNRLKPVPPSTRETLSFEYCPMWLSVLSMRAILLFEYFQYDCPLCPSRKQFFCCLTVHPIRCSSILQKEDFFVIWMFVQYDCVFYLSIEALLYCLSIWLIGLLVLSFNAKNLVAIVQYHLSFYHSTGVILLFLLLSSNSDGPFLFELCSLVLVWGGLPTLKKSQARFFIVFSFLSHTTLI